MAGAPKKIPDEVIDNLISTEISQVAAAKLIGAPASMISKVQNEGFLKPTGKGGLYIVGDFIRDWIKYLQASKSAVRAEDDSKIRKLRIQEMELEQAERSAELVPFMLIKEYIMEKIGKLNGDYQSLPARVTRDMALRKEIQKQITLIHKRFESNLKGH